LSGQQDVVEPERRSQARRDIVLEQLDAVRQQVRRCRDGVVVRQAGPDEVVRRHGQLVRQRQVAVQPR
jgi:hypothetical protein